jgi:hypothetical protein
MCALGLILSVVACGGDSTSGDGDDDTGLTGDGGPAGDGGDQGSLDAMDCPMAVLNLQPVRPEVMLLIDRSGSMTTSFGSGLDRWEAERKALTDPMTGVVTLLQSQVKFGAALYDGNSSTCPDLVTDGVTPAFNNRDAIDALLAAHGPAGDTPTGESIHATLDFMAGLPVDPDGQETTPYIVLSTDGEPDTCAVPNPQHGQAEAIAGAQEAYAAGVKLFILSVGNEVGATHQQDMANAGAGLPIDHSMGDAPYFNGANPADLSTKFQQIINGVRDCTIAIDRPITAVQAAQGTVILDGSPLDMGTDWEVVDDTHIRLLGATCTGYLADPNPTIVARFPCGVIID